MEGSTYPLPSLPPPRIAALPPLPSCTPPPPVRPPLPVPLLYRRDNTRGREMNLPPWARFRSRQGGPPQRGFASDQVFLEGSREGGRGEAGHGESKGTRRLLTALVGRALCRAEPSK